MKKVEMPVNCSAFSWYVLDGRSDWALAGGGIEAVKPGQSKVDRLKGGGVYWPYWDGLNRHLPAQRVMGTFFSW